MLTRRTIVSALAATPLFGLMTGARATTTTPLRPSSRLLPPGTGKDRTVIIAGAGVTGLALAYELQLAGFDVQVLEALDRPGGRSHTLRTGDTVLQEGLPDQVCRFDEDLYLNLGPGRIPHHHKRVLRYCQELGVALEPYVKQAANNLYWNEKGFAAGTHEHRQIDHDGRGHLAALLGRQIRLGQLNMWLDPDDREGLLSWLKEFGDLDIDGQYQGSTRAGLIKDPDVYTPPAAKPPLILEDLIQSRFWKHQFYHAQDHLWQATMFQPVGGMDQIVFGFTRHAGSRISYGAAVTGFKVTPHESVTVSWTQQGRTHVRTVDFVISTIPCPRLVNLEHNFSPSFTAAIGKVTFAPACKVGWQAEQRFWETRHQIFGGISWTPHLINQLWYPSNGFFTGKGTLTGAYNRGADALTLGDMDLPARLRIARQGGAGLHPEFVSDTVIPDAKGVSIAWHQVPHQSGGWAQWSDTQILRGTYGRLLLPDGGRFFVGGDQISPLPGWQEGALISAEWVGRQIGGREESRQLPDIKHAPVTYAP